MTNVSMFEIEQCRNSYNVKTDTDDVFDEIVEKGLKTENEKQVRYEESDDVFDEAFERQVDLSCPNIELENKLTLTVKCLYKDEEDDVFDEESEKEEIPVVKHDVGFVNINSGIKIEPDEDDTVYEENNLQENLGSSTDGIKEENGISSTENIQSYNYLLMQNIISDIESSIEVCEKKIKAEVDIENEGTRINEYNCRKCTFKATQKAVLEKHSLSHKIENSNKSGTSVGTQKNLEENNTNVNNEFEKEKLKHVGEKQTETKKIKLREQNEKIVKANTFVANIGDKKKMGKEGELCSFDESAKASDRKQSSRNKQKEDSSKSYSKIANKKRKPGVSENVQNITGKKENIGRIPKELTEKTISNNGASNAEDRDTVKKYTPQENKLERKKDGQELLSKKNQSVSVPKKTLNREEKRKCHGKQSLKTTTARGEKEDRLHKEMELAETITVSKKNIKETVTEKTHNENKKSKTHARTDNQKSLDKSKQKKTDILLSSNLPAIKNVANDTQLENIEYCCTKCPFKTRQRTMFKTHLTKHGTEFFSGVISFLDLVNNEKATNQLESGQVQDEIKEQCTVVALETEDEKKLENEDEVESCKSSQSSCEITDKNCNRVTEIAENQRSEVLDIESNTICEKNETIILDKENEEGVRTAATNIEIASENSEIVQNKETQINKKINSEIELLEPEIKDNEKAENQNENSEVLDEEINTETIVTNKEREETPLQVDKNEENNADSISENVENLVTQSQCDQIFKTNEVKLESGKRNKRKPVEKTSPASKRIKLEKDQKYRCDECPYQSDKKRYFDNHKIIHSKDVIKCNYCDFITNLQRYMTSHMLVHLQPEETKMHKCPHCSYQTKRRGDLPIHMVLHKKPEEIQMFQCDKCSYTTKRKSNLRSHQLSHKSADDIIYSCDLCSFTAKKRYTIKSHMIVHQKMEEIHWYRCDQCSYITKCKAALRRHSLVHKNRDEIRTYDCPECLYKAKHKSHLKSHLLIHKDPKEVEMHHCDHCSYKAIKKCNLTAHMLQHKKTEEINMKKCAHCPYETKLKCNLIKHINRIHSRTVQ